MSLFWSSHASSIIDLHGDVLSATSTVEDVTPTHADVTTERPPTTGVSFDVPTVISASVLRLKDGPTDVEKWLTEDGFTMTSSNQKRSYGDVAKHSHKTVYTNSSRQWAQRREVTRLQAIPVVRRKNNSHNLGYSRNNYNKDQFELFVSRLVPGIEPQTVSRYLKSKYNGDFKVEQLRAKYDEYCSFKITAPAYLKRKLLDRNNWEDNLYVREFFPKSRQY